MDDHHAEIARRAALAIQQARRAAGLTQAECAKRMGVHWTQWSRWESGKYVPLASTLAQMEQVLGTKLDFTVPVPDPEPLTADTYKGMIQAVRRLRVQLQAIEDDALRGLAGGHGTTRKQG